MVYRDKVVSGYRVIPCSVYYSLRCALGEINECMSVAPETSHEEFLFKLYVTWKTHGMGLYQKLHQCHLFPTQANIVT